MIDFTSFGKLIPDSVQLHYSLSTASLQLPYSLNSYRSLYLEVFVFIALAGGVLKHSDEVLVYSLGYYA